MITFLIPHFGPTALLQEALDSIVTTAPGAVVLIGDDTHKLKRGDLSAECRAKLSITIFPGPKSSFAAQVNNLLQRVKTDWAVIMNNDVVLRANWGLVIEQSIKGARPNTGMIASQILLPSGVIDSAGDAFSPIGIGYKRLRHLPADSKPSAACVSVSGALMVLRVKLWRELKKFDEQIGTYFEDVDFGLRAQGAGYEIKYVAEAKAVHRESSTITADFRQQRAITNSVLVVRKNFIGRQRKILLRNLTWWWLGYGLLHPSRFKLVRQLLKEAGEVKIAQIGAQLQNLPGQREPLNWWQTWRQLRQNYRFTTGFW